MKLRTIKALVPRNNSIAARHGDYVYRPRLNNQTRRSLLDWLAWLARTGAGAAGRMRAAIGPALGCYFMDFGSGKASEIASFFDWFPRTGEVFDKVKVAAENATEAVQATCTTTFDSAAAMNVKLIEAGRSNSNAALEFARTIIAAKSPLDVHGLMIAYSRKQLELWAEQTKELSNLAQKVTREAVNNGVGKVFNQAA
jgi:hypothetical protein